MAKSSMEHRVRLGQFFSPEKLVDVCISLIKNNGRLLEPSCGAGAFLKAKRKDSVFIELDHDVITDDDVICMDFFDYPKTEKFDTVIGNPPYVDNSLFDISHDSRIKVQANLYLYFIEKCFDHLNEHGEIIFIVPREFIKLTSARTVNSLLVANGTITHYYDYGDERLFDDACPNVCIFRYEKDNFDRTVKTLKGDFELKENDGLISFIPKDDAKSYVRLGDLFEIKVGAVSGADKLFENEQVGDEFVCSKTRSTGQLRKLIYQRYDESLEPLKDILIKRKIKHFTEADWFAWGRTVDFRFGQPRIYVNCKTRTANPFFINSCDRWDGAELALFPKHKIDLENAVKALNGIDWETLGFVTGGRYIFSQKALQEAPVDGRLFK